MVTPKARSSDFVEIKSHLNNARALALRWYEPLLLFWRFLMRHRSSTRIPICRQTTARQVVGTALSKIVRRLVRNLSRRLAERTQHGDSARAGKDLAARSGWGISR